MTTLTPIHTGESTAETTLSSTTADLIELRGWAPWVLVRNVSGGASLQVSIAHTAAPPDPSGAPGEITVAAGAAGAIEVPRGFARGVDPVAFVKVKGNGNAYTVETAQHVLRNPLEGDVSGVAAP